MASHVRLALRCNVSDDRKVDLVQWISKYDGYILVREEKEGNKHCHAIIDTTKQCKAVRSDFVRAFPECVGNAGYSVKICDDDWAAYIRYICKGDGPDVPPVVWGRSGLLYTDQHIADAHAKYYVNQAAVLENAGRRKRLDKLNLVEDLEKRCKAAGHTSRNEISREYIRVYRDARKGINVFAARAVVNTVWCLLQGEHAEEELAHKIAEL